MARVRGPWVCSGLLLLSEAESVFCGWSTGLGSCKSTSGSTRGNPHNQPENKTDSPSLPPPRPKTLTNQVAPKAAALRLGCAPHFLKGLPGPRRRQTTPPKKGRAPAPPQVLQKSQPRLKRCAGPPGPPIPQKPTTSGRPKNHASTKTNVNSKLWPHGRRYPL